MTYHITTSLAVLRLAPNYTLYHSKGQSRFEPSHPSQLCKPTRHPALCAQPINLRTKSHPPIRTNHRPRTPPRILRAKHRHHARNLEIIAKPAPRLLRLPHILLVIDPLPHPHQRRRLNQRLHLPLKLLARSAIHIRRDRPGIDGIDRGAFRQLARPGPRHGLQRRLRAAVDGLPDGAQRRADGRDVDDAAGAVRGQVRHRGLHEQ